MNANDELRWAQAQDERGRGTLMQQTEKHAGINVKFKRLSPDAATPKFAHEGDAGFDLVATEDVIVEPGATVKVPTGLAVELPAGFELQVRPRSGVTLRTKLRVQLGTVDSNYRGEIGVIVDNTLTYPSMTINYALTVDGGTYKLSDDYEVEGNSYIIRKGDRIAQAVINRVPAVQFTEVDELGDTSRGEGGFGSTGVKLTEGE